jgi:hypothetical protein
VCRAQGWIQMFPRHKDFAAATVAAYGVSVEVGKYAGEEKWQRAAEAMSMWRGSNGTAFDEPTPGVVVLNNAHFQAGTLIMHDCQVRHACPGDHSRCIFAYVLR